MCKSSTDRTEVSADEDRMKNFYEVVTSVKMFDQDLELPSQHQLLDVFGKVTS